MTNTTAPAFTHTLTCDWLALGRAVDHLRSVTERLALTVAEIDNQAMKSRGQCTCGRDALRKVEADLTLTRKRERALRNSPAFGSAEYSRVANEVDGLVARRAAIREAIA